MSDKTRHEHQIEFRTYFAYNRPERWFNNRGLIRMAGQIWQKSPQEESREASRKRLQQRSKHTPVGYNYREDGIKGPDNNYATVEPLSSTHDLAY